MEKEDKEILNYLNSILKDFNMLIEKYKIPKDELDPIIEKVIDFSFFLSEKTIEKSLKKVREVV